MNVERSIPLKHPDGRIDLTVWTGNNASVLAAIDHLKRADQHPDEASRLIHALGYTLTVISERSRTDDRLDILMQVADAVINSDHPVLAVLSPDSREHLIEARSAAIVQRAIV